MMMPISASLRDTVHCAIDASKERGIVVTIPAGCATDTLCAILAEECDSVAGLTYHGADIDGNKWSVKVI